MTQRSAPACVVRINTILRGAWLALSLPFLVASGQAQPVIETVFFDVPENLLTNPIPAPTAQLAAVPGYPDDPARLTLIARLYRPDPSVFGAGPYPTVLFLHGAGGMWSNDTIPNPITAANAPASQFRDWGNLLVGMGYAALMVDSFNPRGIAAGFDGRRPHYDPAADDALCSPNYERPKDVVAALTYLASRADIDRERIALIGFSHGAQTGMNSLLDVSVDLGTYEVDYVDFVNNAETTVKKTVPSPVRIPSGLPIPKFCAFYYGGGSHYAYHGQASSAAAGRYMMDRRTTAILFHGTGDSLMGTLNFGVAPITGSVFPMQQVLASGAQAATLGLPNPIVRHYILNRTAVQTPGVRVGHSFDLGTVTIAAVQDQDTANESPNQKARRLARGEVLRWLEFKLQAGPVTTIQPSLNAPANHVVSWPTRARLGYQLARQKSCPSQGILIHQIEKPLNVLTVEAADILWKFIHVAWRRTHQHQSPKQFRPSNRRHQPYHTAHRVTHENHFSQSQGIDYLDYVRSITVETVVAHRIIGLIFGTPGPHIIKKHHEKLLLKRRHHKPPHLLVAAKSVREHECTSPTTRHPDIITLNDGAFLVSHGLGTAFR